MWIKINGEYLYRLNDQYVIIVNLDSDSIRFSTCEMPLNGFPSHDKCQIHAISLVSKKDTGNTILNVKDKDVYLYPKGHIDTINHSYCLHFPINKNSIFQIVFLDFVSVLEEKNNIFADASEFECIRKKLHKSTVYKLLVAKLSCANYNKNRIPQNSTIYNRLVVEFSDLLMDSKITSILPPDKVGKNCLFENPEYELQKIISKNSAIRWSDMCQNVTKKKILCFIFKNLCILVLGFLLYHTLYLPIYFILPLLLVNLWTFESCFGNECQIENNVRKKVQDFFLLKHSTISSYYMRTGKILFLLTCIIMVVWSVFIIYTSLFQTTSVVNCNWFNYKSLLNYGIFISTLFLVNAIFVNRNFNSLFSRIIIALIAAWSLIVLSGDFVFSHLLNDNRIINLGIFFIGLIIVFVLYIECKKQSPYFTRNPFLPHFWKLRKLRNWKECTWKILPILSFSIFLSLLLGIIIQLATYQPLLKTGNTLYSVTFSSEFKDIEHHITNTQLLIDNLEAYKREILHFPKKTSIHKGRINQIDTIKQQLCKHHKDTINHWLNPITENKLSIKKQKITNYIDSLLPLLHSHIHSHQDFLTHFYDADSLLNLCCDTNSYKGDYRIIYDDFFKSKKALIQGSITSTSINIRFFCIHIDREFYIFRKLLVFQSFLAVLIAFIVQIIFTGKSITEKL